MTQTEKDLAAALRPIRSILILQIKDMGDVVLSSTLNANLRLAYPGVRIVVLCTKGFEKFILTHGIGDDAVALDRKRLRGVSLARGKDFIAVIKKLRSFRVDMSIDLTDSRTSRLIAGLVKAPLHVGYNPPERPMRWFERQPANMFAKPFGYDQNHFLYRYLSPLETLNVPLRIKAPSLRPSPQESAKASILLAQHELQKNAFVAIHAGAAFQGRMWQPERFADVIDYSAARHGLAAVLVGGPEEKGIAAAVLATARTKVVNLVGAASLEQLLAIVAQARMFLGNESGPMHMAAAAGTPVVGLFGLTDPIHWGPVGVENIALRPSMPCDCIAPEVCKRIDPRKAYCVRRLTVEEVSAAVDRLLAKTADRAPEAAEAPSA